MTVSIAAFYKFVRIDDTAALQIAVRTACRDCGVLGTFLIAEEGINATISAGTPEAMDRFLAWLKSDLRFADLFVKTSFAPAHPFKRLKVRLKREIVTFGADDADPNVRVGTYVKAQDWNALIREEGVTLIDTRNAYEVAIGTFEGAIDPRTAAFGDFPKYAAANLDPKRHSKIAMFCTGGIRCEKASAYLLGLGFPEVYHLEGGILNYLETVPESESLWRGDCYIFDERVSLKHGVVPGAYENCPSCGYPVIRENSALCPNCGSLSAGDK